MGIFLKSAPKNRFSEIDDNFNVSQDLEQPMTEGLFQGNNTSLAQINDISGMNLDESTNAGRKRSTVKLDPPFESTQQLDKRL